MRNQSDLAGVKSVAKMLLMAIKPTMPSMRRKEKSTMKMQEQLTRQPCRISTLFAEGFPAKVFQLPERGVDLRMTPEELSSLKSHTPEGEEAQDLSFFCCGGCPVSRKYQPGGTA